MKSRHCMFVWAKWSFFGLWMRKQWAKMSLNLFGFALFALKHCLNKLCGTWCFVWNFADIPNFNDNSNSNWTLHVIWPLQLEKPASGSGGGSGAGSDSGSVRILTRSHCCQLEKHFCLNHQAPHKRFWHELNPNTKVYIWFIVLWALR